MFAKRRCPNAPRLRGLLAGSLPAGEQAELERHLEDCPACQTTLQELSDGGEKWAELASDLGGEGTGSAADSGERRLLERLGASPPGDTTIGVLGAPDGAGTAFLDPPTGPGQLGRMGPYEVRKLLGRGGMGVVFEAYDPKLRRAVALKVLAPHLADTPGARERFLREARAAAGISHDHVVTVHGVEEAGPAPYLAMELVRGGSLEDRLRQDGPLLPAEAARLAAQVARGLAAAHARGLTHRDVKPANVLIEEGTGCARLTDFGLARAADDVSLTQSGAVAGTPSYMAPEQAAGKGQDVGPAVDVYGLGATLYALLTGRAPFQAATMLVTLEQVCGREPVAPRHLQPTVPRDLETICLKCLEKDPRRRYPSAEALADDLDRFREGRPIVARPAGAVERLAKWVRRRPAVAALLALVALVPLLLVGGLAAVSWQWRQTEQARQKAAESADDERAARRKASDSANEERKAHGEADARRQEADRERHKSQAMSASLALDQGIRLCEEGKVGPGLLWMARALELTPDDEADLDYTARANLSAWRGEFCPSRKSGGQGTAVLAVAISPDGKTVLTGDLGNEMGNPGPARAQLWDAATWKPRLAQPVTHPSAILSVAFSPDGLTFATGSYDGTIRRWQTATGAPVGAPLEHGGPVYSIAFSRDGAALAGGGWQVEGWEKRAAGTQIRILGGEVRVWEAATGRPRGEPLRLPGILVRAVAWAPDGRSLAVGGYLPGASGKTTLQDLLPSGADRAAVGGMALVWDVAGGKVLAPQMLHADAVTAVAFHPEGKVLATACADGVVRQWDVQTHLRRGPQLRHPDSVNALAFSRDGRVIATGSGSHQSTRGEARLWDAATGQLLVQPLVHRDSEWAPIDKVHAVALASDGRALATASEDGHAWLWDVAGAPTSQAVLRSPHPGFSLTFSPDGRTLLMGHNGDVDQPGELRLFDAQTGIPTGVVLPLPTAVMPPRFSPDGARLLAVSHRDSKKEHLLRLWETATGKLVGIPPAVAQGVTWASFSADGKTLWTGGADGKLRSWDSLTFAPRGGPLDHGKAIAWADVSADGRRAVTGDRRGSGTGGVVRLWDLVEGKPVGGPLLEKSYPTEGRFLAGSRVFVTTVGGSPSAEDPECWRHDAEDGRPLGPPLLRGGFTWGLRDLHPDGRSFLTLTGGSRDSVQQWDSLTGHPRGVLPPFPAAAAAFHPSGRFIALAASENARLWSLETGKPIGPPLSHPSAVGVAFHPDGRLLATWSNQDQTARLWKLADPVAGSPAEVKRRVEALTGQELDEAGNPRDLKGDEWEKRRRQVEGLAPWSP